MKKIGIVTIIDYYNYGNRLQNYAVSHLLNDRLGCSAVTLEGYAESFTRGNAAGMIKEQLALQLCRFPRLAERLLPPYVIRWFNFSRWSRRWIPRKRFYSCKELPNALDRQFDLFICGSDQVWNCRLKNFRADDFFLSFTADHKKIALSASFGINELPKEQKDFYRTGLAGFSHISVREEAGARIVRELTGKDVPVLIDPVLILGREEWIRTEKEPGVDISRPYVLKYYLGETDTDIDRWARDKGFALYDLMDPQTPALCSAGPGEFISLVRNAGLICTDSFHCTALAILFRRPFIVYDRRDREESMISRMDTLLGKFGFEERRSSVLEPEDYLNCHFDYAEERLAIERQIFMNYLKEILYEP